MMSADSGAAAVGVLLAAATLAQVSAGFMTQLREGGTDMIDDLNVFCSALMVTASSVLSNIASASSANS
jgi:hypothetical protein